MQDADTTLIKDIMRVFILEHWARFYYAEERDGKTFLEMPPEALEKSRQETPDLAPLLEETNNTELTYESSCQNVGAFVCRMLDGEKYPPGKVTKTLDSRPFRIEMHMFALWLKGHETYLDQNPQGYHDWLEMFTNWMLMDEVKAFATRMEQSPPPEGKDAKTAH